MLCCLPPGPSAWRSEQVAWNRAGTSEFPIRHKRRRLWALVEDCFCGWSESPCRSSSSWHCSCIT